MINNSGDKKIGCGGRAGERERERERERGAKIQKKSKFEACQFVT